MIQNAIDLNTEVGAIDRLMQRYQSVPMSLADACLANSAGIPTPYRLQIGVG